LGTVSEQKINIIKRALDKKGVDARILSFEVNSGIADQPFGEDIIVQGSINRAQNVIKKSGEEYDISLGLEGGMCKVGSKWYYMCVVSLVDKKGNIYSGISRKNPIPSLVVQQINNGAYFADVIRKFRTEISEEDKDLTILIEELINRTESFTEAFDSAWTQYKLSPHFS
jgi:inosine/xanthosine triphosphatase